MNEHNHIEGERNARTEYVTYIMKSCIKIARKTNSIEDPKSS